MCKSAIDSVTLVGRHRGCQFLSLQHNDKSITSQFTSKHPKSKLQEERFRRFYHLAREILKIISSLGNKVLFMTL